MIFIYHKSFDYATVTLYLEYIKIWDENCYITIIRSDNLERYLMMGMEHF